MCLHWELYQYQDNELLAYSLTCESDWTVAYIYLSIGRGVLNTLDPQIYLGSMAGIWASLGLDSSF